MNGGAGHCIYPISLRNAPPALIALLRDAGVPVIEVGPGERAGSIEIVDGHVEKNDFDHASGVSLIIQATDLLPDGVSWAMLEQEAATPVAARWREGGVCLSESVIRERWSNQVIMKLRQIITGRGLPWVCLAHHPAGYSGVFNFRVDLDEPAPEDWRRVLDALEPVEPAVTWFLSTLAAERAPCIYDWLEGRDVQSHGHWHHVHGRDSQLNQLNLMRADELLKKHGYQPTGFASPCGRMTADLPDILDQLQYQYLAGIGDLCGSMPRRMANGLWRVNALPVSEGLYLEENINDIEPVIEGYMQVARRASSRNRPLFWYGHAERRLGRKPAILYRLVREIQNIKGLWHVTLGEYVNWLESRRLAEVSVLFNPNLPDQLQLQCGRANSFQTPLIHVENQAGRWPVVMPADGSATVIKLDPSQCRPLAVLDIPEELHLQHDQPGLKKWLKDGLDWERETPVQVLRGGPVPRRAKGFLRARTDQAWRSRFVPKAWVFEDEPGQAVA